MSYFDSLVFEELKNLNKNMRKLVHGVNVMAGIESPKAAGWKKESVEDLMERSVFSEPVYNIEAILERADVRWRDDHINGYRVVTSMNPDAPLTKSEQDALTRMWRAQGVISHVIFEVESRE